MRVAHSLGKALVNKGHEVTVCTTNIKDENSLLGMPLDEKMTLDGISVYYEAVVNKQWGYSPSLKNRIKQEIKKTDIVITHFHYQYASYIGGVLARKNKKPLIVFSHGSLNKRGVLRKNAILKYFYINLFEKKNFNNAAFIAFNCEEERELSYFNKNGHVIPNGIDPVEFSSITSLPLGSNLYPEIVNKRVYLFLGRLNYKQKGLEILLPAFHKAVLKDPMIHLVIAGPDENGGESLVRKAILDYKISKNVTLTGMLNDNEKNIVLQAADVFVLPSPSEGLSIALLEALYMSLPIITTTGVGLHKRIKQENAGVVIDYDIEQLFKAILYFIEDTKITQMKGKGRKIIKSGFTWNKIAEQFLETIYIDLGIR